MSLATRLEQAIRKRINAAAAENACAHANAQNEIGDLLQDNESAILAALKFQEAVERHGIHLTPCHPPLTEAYWLAQTCIRGQEAMAPTPAAAVASLVAELEKK